MPRKTSRPGTSHKENCHEASSRRATCQASYSLCDPAVPIDIKVMWSSKPLAMIFLRVKACDGSLEGMIGVTWMVALERIMEMLAHRESTWKILPWKTRQIKKFTRAVNVKVNVAFHMRKTSPILKILFIFTLYLLYYFYNKNMGVANQIRLGTKLEWVKIPW